MRKEGKEKRKGAELFIKFLFIRYTTFRQTNQGEALYIIYSAGIAYHQHAVLHLIKPQLIQPSADDMRLRR